MKISDAQFISFLRDNAGLYGQTAKAIQEKLKIDYTRQAVRERAENLKEILEDINGENLDVAEGGLHELMKSENETIRLRAIELYLRTKGKHRGYSERTEIKHSGDANEPVTFAGIKFSE